VPVCLSPPSDFPSLSLSFVWVGRTRRHSKRCLPSLLCEKERKEEGEEEVNGEEEEGKEGKTLTGLSVSFSSLLICSYMCYMSERGKKRKCVCSWVEGVIFIHAWARCLGEQQQQ